MLNDWWVAHRLEIYIDIVLIIVVAVICVCIIMARRERK